MSDIQRLHTLLDFECDFTETYDEIKSLFNSETFQLKDAQVKALAPIAHYRRGFFSAGVGHGKTLISLLAPLVARSKRAILLVPSDLVDQLTKVEIPKYEKEFNINLDWCSIAGLGQHKRREALNKKRITIMPYSLLSTVDTITLLEESKVDMIVADECQYLKVEKSPRTKRLMKFIDEFKPAFVCMSGTVIKRNLKDYWHLISRCLGQLSPLPFDYHSLAEMQEVIDPYNDYPATLSQFFARLDPTLKITPSSDIVSVDKSRKFMKRLFDSSPGTIRTENQSVECSLQVNIIETELDEVTKKALETLEKTWTTPFGDEIEDALQFSAIHSQLLSGFYYRLYWPEDIEEWVIEEFNKINELKKEIRYFLKRYKKGLDTPGLVFKALEARDKSVTQLFPFYDKVENWDLPDRNRDTITLSKYRIDDARKWADTHKEGIIWYKWDATGPLLAKAIPEATFCPAGTDIENLQKDGLLICSFAHTEGKNMQQQNRNLLFNFPLNAADFEQLMGRTHRQGQEADCVFYDIIVGSQKEKHYLKNVMKQAQFLNDTDKDQKLILADWAQPDYIGEKT